MRNQWRILHLLLRTHHKIPIQSHTLRSFSSTPLRFNTNYSKFLINPNFRHFSSEPVIPQPNPDHIVIVDLFSKSIDLNEVNKHLDLINHDAVNAVLRKFDSDLDSARRLFKWVSENCPEKLSSKSYNQMLGVLGINGAVDEFWDLVVVMRKKGFGVAKWVKDRMLEYFEKGGMNGDAVKLKELFDKDTVERKFTSLCRIVRKNVWSDEVEKEIRDLNVGFSSESVNFVLESLSSEPNKALIFFRWVEESGLFKHDGGSYNAVARVLGREDSIDRFWKVVGDMRSGGFEMEEETFVKVLGRFCKRGMIKEGVELYEFAMDGVDKPSVSCFTFLLRKVVSVKELDMNLFSRVLKVFTGNGSALTDSMADAVLKSLTSVGRIGEWNKVLKEMEDCGFIASGCLRRKIAFRLGATGNKEQANEFVDRIEAYGSSTDRKMRESLVEGHCVGGNLDKAFDSFKEMVEKEGVASAGYTFDVLMNSYCQMNRAKDAYKILCKWVSEKELKPRHSTYKLMVNKLLAQGGFTDALNLLGLMRTQGFPPFTEPFIEHISKSGSGDDAVLLLKAMTSKKFPSTSVYHVMFSAFFKQGRHVEAQNFLSKCPSFIRDDAEVLDLFYSMNSKEAAASSGKVAA
ncbi:putative pentatricopeptide [Medicago truncatula]|uniref:PPR containing plant protein n=1 Tax=Medicago truncatula TaxID=3880 RepID=A0A072TWI4_MEDTR|nr:pentatricopeptide repeat-containing protein At3g02490, mitochondrial [Medicago truncatula]KEH21802.1 PPR containing plant protein [Medicago truncatula]RHN44561.1 putative pentatricopeptide [Medicago truncatula]